MGMKTVVTVLLSLLFSVADCRVTGGHLKWMFDANDGYSPYNSPFVPPILKGIAPGDERVAVLSRTANGNWAVDGLSIVNGQFVVLVPHFKL